jgi:hypothetical protein
MAPVGQGNECEECKEPEGPELNFEAAHGAQERAQGGEQLYVAAADGAPLGAAVE